MPVDGSFLMSRGWTIPFGARAILPGVSKRPRKPLSERDQRKVAAKRAAHDKKRSEAEDRRWWRENISPIFENINAPLEDDIRSYGPVKPGSTAAVRQERRRRAGPSTPGLM